MASISTKFSVLFLFFYKQVWYTLTGAPRWLSGKELTCNAGDTGSIPGEGNGNAFQCSCLGNPMDRGAWQGIVLGVRKSQTLLSN